MTIPPGSQISPNAASEISRLASIILAAGDVAEIRVPNAGRAQTISGYFNDREKLVQAVNALDKSGHPGVYITLNPVNPDLLARAVNRVKDRAKATTADKDILRRVWLPIDIDPRRPAGISSNDAEHQAALKKAQQIKKTLTEEGWPVPVIADSGNGGHALYLIDLPNDEASMELIKGCLASLAARFDDELVQVDLTTFNAARIWRVYGTTSRKGDPTPERPHRRSTILSEPDKIQAVPLELLQAVAAESSGARGQVVQSFVPHDRGIFDLEDFLHRHSIRTKKPVAHRDGLKYVLDECPFDPSHKAPDAAVFQAADGKLGFSCFHNSCAKYDWAAFRGRFEPEHNRTASGTRAKGVRTATTASRPGIAPWPSPIAEEGYYGLAGRFVRLVEPHTEADPNILLIQFLVYAGSVFGRDAYVVGGDTHYPNLYLCVVGATTSGRKGTSIPPVNMFFEAAEPTWAGRRTSGLSSGEGLIVHVRDPLYGPPPKSKGAKAPAGQAAHERAEGYVCIDPGVPDKRLLIQETEFYSVIQRMQGTGNTLSPIVRDAFDGKILNTMVKNNPTKATGAHISIIGNITKEELLRGAFAGELQNGFANRFMWACSRRSKRLPEGGELPQVKCGEEFKNLINDWAKIKELVTGQVRRDAEAGDLWGRNEKPDQGLYAQLTREHPSMFGVVTCRAVTIVLRLALIYARLDCSAEIRREHLEAAVAVWKYCSDSARFIFGDMLTDPKAQAIRQALQGSPCGLTRTEINRLVFHSNAAAQEMDAALTVLEEAGIAQRHAANTKGRPVEHWSLA